MFSIRLSALAGSLIVALSSNIAAAQTGFYVFGGLGTTNSDITLGGLNRVDDDHSSYFLGAGYAATENLSIEAGFLDASNHYAETDCPPGFACLTIPVVTQADVTGISLSVVGSLPVADRFDVYGRLGITRWDVEFDGISTAFDSSGEDLLYGAGLRMAMGDHWNMFAEYQRINLDVSTANIGVSYRF